METLKDSFTTFQPYLHRLFLANVHDNTCPNMGMLYTDDISNQPFMLSQSDISMMSLFLTDVHDNTCPNMGMLYTDVISNQPFMLSQYDISMSVVDDSI